MAFTLSTNYVRVVKVYQKNTKSVHFKVTLLRTCEIINHFVARNFKDSILAIVKV